MLRSSERKCQANRGKRERPKSRLPNPSTTVPLTTQPLEPTMRLHDLLRWFRRRRKPSEELNRKEVYFSEQAFGVSRLTLV